jgi:hypothetical protein
MSRHNYVVSLLNLNTHVNYHNTNWHKNVGNVLSKGPNIFSVIVMLRGGSEGVMLMFKHTSSPLNLMRRGFEVVLYPMPVSELSIIVWRHWKKSRSQYGRVITS